MYTVWVDEGEGWYELYATTDYDKAELLCNSFVNSYIDTSDF